MTASIVSVSRRRCRSLASISVIIVPGWMTTYDWLLFLHVTGAFLLVGGAVVAIVLDIAAQRRERPVKSRSCSAWCGFPWWES